MYLYILTFFYDTIYALQDIKDDSIIGVNQLPDYLVTIKKLVVSFITLFLSLLF